MGQEGRLSRGKRELEFAPFILVKMGDMDLGDTFQANVPEVHTLLGLFIL